MTRVVTVGILCVILFSLPVVIAQGQPRNERNEGGMLINQDYFIVNQYEELRGNLKVVEEYHLNKRVMNDVMAGRGAGIADLKYTLDKFPNHPKALMLLGMGVRIRKDDLLLPVTYYQKALRLYPQYALTHAQYGAFLVDIGQVDVGITRLQKAIEIDPKLAIAYNWLSDAYTKNGNLEMARQAAEKAKELSAKDEK